MKSERLPARVLYEKNKSGAVIEIRGSTEEILTALVRLIYSASSRTGFSVDTFAEALPALIALDKKLLASVETFDLESLRRAKDGGAAHE